MKRFLRFFIPVLVLGALAYQFRDALSGRILPLWDIVKTQVLRRAPCSEPIPYVLGTFDTQFKISEKYFLSALAEAEAIWEKPAQKDLQKELFTYAPNDSSRTALKINLIYDYRQQATNKLSSLGITVENNKASYDALKSKFTALKAEYEKEKDAFNARVNSFNQRKKDYEDQVDYWNKQGGAPKKEYEKLQAARLALNADSDELQKAQANLNETVEELNALVVVLNQLAGTLNLSVEKYNTVNEGRGESFEEGVYYSEGLNRQIDIYEFENREKLVRVLAHELGHALGLPHVSDSKAIMYEFNQGNNQVLTAADLAALKTKCQIK